MLSESFDYTPQQMPPAMRTRFLGLAQFARCVTWSSTRRDAVGASIVTAKPTGLRMRLITVFIPPVLSVLKLKLKINAKSRSQKAFGQLLQEL